MTNGKGDEGGKLTNDYIRRTACGLYNMVPKNQIRGFYRKLSSFWKPFPQSTIAYVRLEKARLLGS